MYRNLNITLDRANKKYMRKLTTTHRFRSINVTLEHCLSWARSWTEHTLDLQDRKKRDINYYLNLFSVEQLKLSRLPLRIPLRCPNLRNLSLDCCNILGDDIFIDCSNLCRFDYRSHMPDSACAKVIAQIRGLKILHITSSYLWALMTEELCSNVTFQLDSLLLSSWGCRSQNMPFLVQFLTSQSETLRQLDIDSVQPECLAVIFKMSQLIELTLSDSQRLTENSKGLQLKLETNFSIQTFHFKPPISDNILGPFLERMPNLKTLTCIEVNDTNYPLISQLRHLEILRCDNFTLSLKSIMNGHPLNNLKKLMPLNIVLPKEEIWAMLDTKPRNGLHMLLKQLLDFFLHRRGLRRESPLFDSFYRSSIDYDYLMSFKVITHYNTIAEKNWPLYDSTSAEQPKKVDAIECRLV